MSQYMLLVYEEEADPAEQAERETTLPMFVELHRSLREAGLLGGSRDPKAVGEAGPAVA